MAARFAGLSRVLLRAQIRHLQTLVFVGSTNAKGDSTLLATLFTDEDSKLGRVITEEVMRMHLGFSHPRDELGSSGSSMDLQPKLEAEDPLTSSKDGLDSVTPVAPPDSRVESSSSSSGQGSEALMLANATDLSHFGFFQRGAAHELTIFVARTVTQRTQPGQRHSVQHEDVLPQSVIAKEEA